MKKDTGEKYYFKGKWLTVPQIAEKYNLNVSTVRSRLKKGHDNDKIIKSANPKQYTINGETMTISDFARKYGIRYNTLMSRIQRNVPDEFLLLSAEDFKKRRENVREKTINEIAHSHCLTWTQSALDCYEIGGDCHKCELPMDIQKRCQMRKTIKQIVRKYGKPYDRTDDRNFLKER